MSLHLPFHRLAVCLLLVVTATPSSAVGRLLDVSIQDRDTGALLPVHQHQGEYWVAGTPGRRYAIVLRNRAGDRLLAVTSVDGVNVLSGETAGWDQTGYVLAPSVRYPVTGWRKSNSSVAAFSFSSLSDAYAARTGRPAQVGVIGVAVFREQRTDRATGWLAPDASRLQSRALGAPPASPASPVEEGASDALSERQAKSVGKQADAASEEASAPAKALAQASPSARLGTAHGERETSLVSQTRFERRQTHPDDVVRIRYDSRENLIASGVIRPAAGPLPVPFLDPFPASDQATYVPDPPRRRY